MFKNVFEKIEIPADAKIIFVADMFVDQYVGGAELTSEALINSSPFKVFKLKSKDVNLDLLRNGADRFWIFGNFTGLNTSLFPTIVANLKYSVLEYDYKFCQYRSLELHQTAKNECCNCDADIRGKMVSAFLYGSKGIWWMSEAQKETHMSKFPFLSDTENSVLSSVFSPEILLYIKQLREQNKDKPKEKFIVLGSPSWVKGKQNAIDWCLENGKEFDVIWDVDYEQILQRLATAEGLVYLPAGADTCPRLVIEAKLLGCKLIINENVQHSREEWFNTENLDVIEEYLCSAQETFWSGIKKMIDWTPTISGYTTTMNCVRQGYPYKDCITSMMKFCDEVCVVDGGSDDATWDELTQWAANEPKLLVKQVKRDWNHPRFAVFDGLQKAEARKMCSKEFCWQMDADEVYEDDPQKIIDLAKILPKNMMLVSLPVVEYWGSKEKVRIDINPEKWRLSRNDNNITHGIPAEFRTVDKQGYLHSRAGSDGCDLIFSDTHLRVPFLGVMTQEAQQLRSEALSGNTLALRAYEQWFTGLCNATPYVTHYSWFDIERKLRLYRDYWQNHWQNLWDLDTTDVADNNMFFDSAWKDVTDEMIVNKAKELADLTGGHVFHARWIGQKTPWIKLYV